MDDRRQRLHRIEKVGTNLGRREIEITPLAHKDRFKYYGGDVRDGGDGRIWGMEGVEVWRRSQLGQGKRLL